MAADYVQNGDVTIFFNSMRGWPQLPRQTFKDISEDGQNGVAFLEMGKKGIPFTIQAMTNCADATTAASVHTSLKNLVKTVCSIRRRNLIYPNNFCFDARVDDIRQAVAVQGGVVDGGTWLIFCELDLIYVGTV